MIFMISIEKPVVADFKDITEVFYKTWLDSYPNKEFGIIREDIEGFYKDRFSEEKTKKRIEDILDTSENKLFLVAKDNGFVVGVCRAIKRENFNQLGAIYVLPGYQRRGIGKMFWGKVIEFFGHEMDIVVRVVSYNEKAINFYKKLGFQDTKKHFFSEKFKMPISGSLLPEIELAIRAKK